MGSTTWKLIGVQTIGEGADLVLSGLQLWGATGRIDAGAVLTSSHPPTEGTLSQLSAGVGACRWSAALVQSPGFFLQWLLPTESDAWGLRVSSPSEASAIEYLFVGNGTDYAECSMSPWPGADVLTPVPSAPLRLGVPASGSAAMNGLPSGDFYAASLSRTGKTGVVGGAMGTYLSNDYGQSWSKVLSSQVPVAGALAVSRSGRVCLAGGYPGNLYRSTDFGQTWVSVQSSSQWLAAAISEDEQTMYAAGQSGSAYRSLDGGGTWAAMGGIPAGDWRVICTSNDGQRVFAVPGSGVPMLSTNAGQTWTSVTALASAQWRGAAMSGDGMVLVAGAAGDSSATRNISLDGGVTWSGLTTAPSGSIEDLCISETGMRIGIGSGTNTPCISLDRGQTWTVPLGAPSSAYYASAMSGDGGMTFWGANGVPWLLRLAAASFTKLLRGRALNATRGDYEQTPIAQGLGSVRQLAVECALDLEFGGRGVFYGKVSDDKGKKPLQRRVRLYRSRDGYLVRETWSAADGTYRFTEINERYEYDIEAWDHERNFFAVVANNQLPEVSP